MPIGVCFWTVMILWLLLGIIPAPAGARFWSIGGIVLLFILLALIGWRLFGPVLQ